MADIDQVEHISDPAERAKEAARRLDAIPQYQTRLRKIRQQAVLEMRAAGDSYTQIAEKLGIHRNTVQHIAEGPERRTRRTKPQEDDAG